MTNKILIWVGSLFLALAVAPSAFADMPDFAAYWKDGLRFKAGNNFEFRIGGRIMWDSFFASEDDDIKTALGTIEDGTEFRRARLYTQGEIYGRVKYKAQFDFAGGDVDFKDVYIELKKIPVLGSVKMGHHKVPAGLEILMSSKYMAFIERGLPASLFPERETGISFNRSFFDKRMVASVMGYRDVDGYGEGEDDGDYNFAARVAGQPALEEDWYLHLGGSLIVRTPNNDSVRFRSRPEVHLGPRFVDTGTFAADGATQFGGELGFVYQSFSLQAEYTSIAVQDKDVAGVDDPTFDAFYVYGSWFITGEKRKYKKGAFSRNKPNKNFALDAEGNEEGTGAFELAVRFSSMNLEDGGITGGELQNITIGMNWYLNPVTRLMVNYVMADLDAVGDTQFLLFRAQIDF